jgi:hypothetical protein
MTPWQQWKANNLAKQEAGIITPTALLNPDTPYVDDTVKAERYAICETCPKLLPTKQCLECGCLMAIKTGLLYASCPLQKW